MASHEIPAVPLTVEGYSVLHQMMRFRWSAWRELSADAQKAISDEASTLLAKTPNSAVFSILGHKADLMFVHFRNSFDERPS